MLYWGKSAHFTSLTFLSLITIYSFANRKLAQNNDKTKVVDVSSQQEIDDIIACDDHEISDAFLMSEKVCQLVLKPKFDRVGPSLGTQVILGAHVTSYARIHMTRTIKHCQELTGDDSCVAYTGEHLFTTAKLYSFRNYLLF